MLFCWNTRFRRSAIFILATVIVSTGYCSPAKSRISKRNGPSDSTSTSISNSTELVSLEPEKSDTQKVKAIKSDGFSFDSVVSALVSSPDTLIRMNQLKDKVMTYFEKRSGEGDTAVEKRGHGGYGGAGASPFGHGIGFPSLEGALLSLAFLTFAVFLIDLIQRMVGGYSTGYASPFLGRRKRELPNNIDKFGGRRFSTLASEVLTSIESPLFMRVIEN